VKQPTLNKK